ncbi:PIN domain-containing protein [Ruminococcus sp. HUN007]|uniref:PIN domain-containing protein n=1 Tax=Ruminococcus sp. HUN007 TaxID=1514668 RepID=UPI0005D27F70|nr:PIN domain-containing protein [Ruminococcus sp. HUN007]
MKNAIKEFLEPTNSEKQELWEKCVFVFDTNVLLNLYRYSAKTRSSLLAAFERFKDRIWLPYQVAFEFMRKRCEVIYETVHRYEQFKKEIDAFTTKVTDTLRLTSKDDEINDLKRYLYKWLDINKERNLLVENASDDEILEQILSIFDGRIGDKVEDEELTQIKNEGKERYGKSIPPGYKDDKKKNNEIDDNNAYGDLIIWKQIIKYAKSNDVGIVFVTHDQKEDWWNIVKGKTIGPRIELRREFIEETKQFFHMYTMNSFISEYNRMNDIPIDKSAVEEVFSLDDTDRHIKKRVVLSSSEKIARTIDTLDKINKRIERRRRIIDDIEKKVSEPRKRIAS